MNTTPATETVTVTLTKPQARYLAQLADATDDYHRAVAKLREEAFTDASRVHEGIIGRSFRLGQLGSDADAAIAKVQGIAHTVRAVFPDIDASDASDIAQTVICNYKDEYVEGDEIVL